ncbi:MAG: hypothetical protein ACE5GQ_02460 [Nitrospinales bacterium]
MKNSADRYRELDDLKAWRYVLDNVDVFFGAYCSKCGKVGEIGNIYGFGSIKGETLRFCEPCFDDALRNKLIDRLASKEGEIRDISLKNDRGEIISGTNHPSDD